MQHLKEKIPTIYHSFFPDFIELKLPKEKIATCHSCTLQMSPTSTYINTKCCVYYAQLPNYLLGGLLQDKRKGLTDGQKIARKLIRDKRGISPYGIRKPVWYKAFEEENKIKEEKNTSHQVKETLRCPFYGIDGNCTTWAYREHCCSTYFCFSVGGNIGKTFWENLDKYLMKIEHKLSSFAAKELGCTYLLSKENLNSNALCADDKNKKIDIERYKQIWAGWQGNEEAFYIAAYQLINQLTPKEFSSIIGLKLMNEASNLKALLHQFNENIIPDYLTWNPNTKIEIVDKKKVQLSTKWGNYEVAMTTLPLLQAFDGSKLLSNVAHLAFKAKNSFADDISKLMEIKVLVNL